MILNLLLLLALEVGSYYLPQEKTQIKLQKGQACGGAVQGQCDTNLTCVAVLTSDTTGRGPSSGICSTLAPGCIPCSGVQCPRARKVCPGSHVTDPCGCCPHCARQKGQVCGGPNWSYGYCDRDLTCALFTGLLSARPPQTGVCKVLPKTQRSNPLEDPLCPWLWGCNVRAGACDCYSLQTCHSAFSYSSLEDCLKSMRGDEEYWLDMREEIYEDEEEEACTEWGCEVQGGQCLCRERRCNSTSSLLSENTCQEMLDRESCINVTCPETPVPSCPKDSFLSEQYTFPGKCCPLVPTICTCLFEDCPLEPPTCPPGRRVKLLGRGDGHPGSCCNQYLCVQDETGLGVD